MTKRRNALVATLGAFLIVPFAAFAWTGPTASPPNGNVAAPINVGTTNQVKDGNIGVNGLAVFGNSLFGGSTGSNAYLNFGATTGTSGYGIRDNNGLLEFKNSSSTWQSLQTTLWTLCGGPCGGGGQWTTSGNNIYSNNTGNVGIGTASPGYKLDVRGAIAAGNSDMYFTNTTHSHTGIGNTAGYAAIENASNYGTLMILGRAGTSVGRRVDVYDYLQVNGKFSATGNITAPHAVDLIIRARANFPFYGTSAACLTSPTNFNSYSTCRAAFDELCVGWAYVGGISIDWDLNGMEGFCIRKGASGSTELNIY